MAELFAVQQFCMWTLKVLAVAGVAIALIGKGGNAAKEVKKTDSHSSMDINLNIDIKPFHFHHHKHNE